MSRVKSAALLVALMVTVIWSSSFVIVKFALEALGPLTIAGLRYTLGAAALFPFLLFRKGEKKPISRGLWLRMALPLAASDGRDARRLLRTRKLTG